MDTPAPYTDAQLLAALDYVLSRGEEIYKIHKDVNVGGETGGSVAEAAARWLDERTDRLVWSDGLKKWLDA